MFCFISTICHFSNCKAANPPTQRQAEPKDWVGVQPFLISKLIVHFFMVTWYKSTFITVQQVLVLKVTCVTWLGKVLVQ